MPTMRCKTELQNPHDKVGCQEVGLGGPLFEPVAEGDRVHYGARGRLRGTSPARISIWSCPVRHRAWIGLRAHSSDV